MSQWHPGLARRRRRQGSGSAVDEVTYLRNNIVGGDATIGAFYTTTVGVTSSSGVVDSWDDARGAVGFAPSMTALLTLRPLWDAGLQTITGDGVNDCLQTAASAVFAINGACSIIVVGSAPLIATNSYLASIVDGAGANRRFQVLGRSTGGSGNISVFTDVAADELNSTVAGGTTRRLIIAAKNATTGVGLQVPSVAEQTRLTTAAAAGNNVLATLDYFSGGGSAGTGVLRSILFLNRYVTAGDVTTLTSWAQTYHSAALA